MDALKQEEIDKIADVIWWLKGYFAGARDSYNECPFDMGHVDALGRVIAREKSIARKNELTGKVGK